MKLKVTRPPFDLNQLQREVNILLLSDLHYDINKEAAIGYDPKIKGVEINNELVTTLKNLPKEWHPDIVIIAGDLVNLNKKDNYRDFIDLVKKLTSAYPTLRNAVFTTPGNHDIERTYKDDFIGFLESLYAGKELIPSYTKENCIDLINTFSKEDISKNRNVFKRFLKYESEAFEIYLANQNELYKKKILKKTKTRKKIIEKIKTSYISEILGLSLICHNSSFFCSFSLKDKPCSWNDRNNLFLIKEIIDTSITKINKENPIISFLHHPFYYLNETEHIAATSRENNNTYNNFNKIVINSDLILCGHVHGDLHDPAYLQNSAYLITNGTSFTTDSFENKCYPFTFALIKVNKQLRNFSLKKFIYQPSKDSAPSGFFEKPNNSKKSFKLQQRDTALPPHLECEKIRLLDYFMGATKISKSKFYKFLIYQLMIFHPKLNINENNYDIKESKQKFPSIPDIDFDQLTISSPNHETIFIIIINKYVRKNLRLILEEYKNEVTKNNFPVYFSLNMDDFKESHEYSDFKIRTEYEYFRALVSMSKIDYVSVNLLYHKANS